MRITGTGTDETGRKGTFSTEFTPTRVAGLIGARAAATNSLPAFTAANTTIGPLDTTRLFYSTSLPASMGATETGLPPGVTPVVSYKTQDTNVANYVASVTRPLWLIYHHEPEGDYGPFGGAEFVSEFMGQSALIRAQGNPLVRVCMCSGGYQWETGQGGSDGSYLPPPQAVDVYSQDVYQHQRGTGPNAWPSLGLENYGRFQNWLGFTGSSGRDLAITEYGIDADQLDPTNAAQTRNNRIIKDVGYLRDTLPGLALLSYWWVPSATDKTQDYRFTDAATIDTWHQIEAGSL